MNFGALAAEAVRATVIIPAHNEESVIDACLQRLQELEHFKHVQVIVACNGCTDGTASRVRTYPWVELIDIARASKPTALNAADAHARYWPRVYLDADVRIDSDTILALASELQLGRVLAARPSYQFYLPNTASLLQRYYRARSRTSFFHKALWGAGVYALTKLGHERLGAFPEVTADDLHVHSLYAPDEITILSDASVLVPVPLNIRDTLLVGRRIRRGNLKSSISPTSKSTVIDLLKTTKTLQDLADVAAYIVVALLIRLDSATHRQQRWERDESSRQPGL